MTGLRITHRRIVICFVGKIDPSRYRIIFILSRPLGSAPGCQEAFKIGEAAGVSAVLDIVEQMPSAAIAIPPTLGEKHFEYRGDVGCSAALRRSVGAAKVSQTVRELFE
ncbi:hypothetical protein ACVJBD_007671 [Rhizobium mongolense]